jgi:outer membrane protein insertion porin family
MIFNTEFVFPLFNQQNMRGVVFFDAGNAYESRIDLDDIRMGAGAGVRWYSPMGPLRLELGFNLNRREDEKSQQWEFSIGSLF